MKSGNQGGQERGWDGLQKQNPSATGNAMNRAATHIVAPLSWKEASPGSPFLPRPEEARPPGWACNSLTVGFLISYLCHCVKCWKAGAVGEVCTDGRDVLSASSDQYYCNNSLEPFFFPSKYSWHSLSYMVVWWQVATGHSSLVPWCPATSPAGTSSLGGTPNSTCLLGHPAFQEWETDKNQEWKQLNTKLRACLVCWGWFVVICPCLSGLGSSGWTMLTLGEHIGIMYNLRHGWPSLANAQSKPNGSSLPAWTTQPKEEGLWVNQE